MSRLFFWRSRPVSFEPGETIAAALRRAGILELGPAAGSLQGRVFCGIGTCQSCIVALDGGVPAEACLTLASEGMRIEPVIRASAGGKHD